MNVTQLRQPRLADLVAERLRRDILTGRYQEGEVLPVSAGLMQEFSVSAPAMREAIRMLEADGLLRTRRGSAGGVVVQLPTPSRIGEVIAMVLQSRRVHPDDVSEALAQIEPICALLCAQRSDRHDRVVPVLREAVRKQWDEFDDAAAFMPNARAFHETIVQNCGNQTMIVAIGGLEVIWSAHASTLWDDHNVKRPRDRAGMRDAVAQHERLVDAIEVGDAAKAAELARAHAETIAAAGPPPFDIDVVDASLVSQPPPEPYERPIFQVL
jgi:GntR family transcriptional regulator, transcriptional repressor for pyruvate dehydrogenase complex